MGGPATELIELDGVPAPVRLRLSSRARRFTLRLAPGEELAVLTAPPGVPRTEIHQFLLRNADWLARMLARRPDPIRPAPGARLPIGGIPYEIAVAETCARRVPRIEGDRLVFGQGGHLARQARAFLRDRARTALVPAAHRYAGMLDRKVQAVTLRDTRSRWGSCSSAGRIGFSWRLAMAPEAVADYVAAHEAAHLVEMNHGPRFWALVERLVPEYHRHRAWLADEGRALHSYRFD